MRFRLAASLALCCTLGCTDWNAVKTAFCTFHPGQGDCPQTTGDGGTPADSGSGGGPTFDGGPPLDYVLVLGGTGNDVFGDLALSPTAAEFGVSGNFVNAIDLGNGGDVSAGSFNSDAIFAARYGRDNAALLDGYAFLCDNGFDGRVPPMPLAYVDAGIVLGSTCVNSPTVVLDDLGNAVSIDGGPGNGATDAFLFAFGGASGPGLQWVGTPGDYNPAKGVSALGGVGGQDFFLGLDAPGGAALLGNDGGVTGVPNPLLASLDGTSFTPSLVDAFSCAGSPAMSWESMAVDPSGGTVAALIDAAMSTDGGACSVYFPTIANETVGGGAPGTNRLLYVLKQGGAVLQLIQQMEGQPDAGPLAMAWADPNTLYYAGWVSDIFLGVAADGLPVLVTGSYDVLRGGIPPFHSFQPGPGSSVTFASMALVPGAVPDIWVAGTVRGSLQEMDGGVILSSYGATSDAFLLKIDPTTLGATQGIVVGNPAFDVQAEKVQAMKADGGGIELYVGGTITPDGGAASSTLGGRPVGFNGEQDVLVFRITVP